MHVLSSNYITTVTEYSGIRDTKAVASLHVSCGFHRPDGRSRGDPSKNSGN